MPNEEMTMKITGGANDEAMEVDFQEQPVEAEVTNQHSGMVVKGAIGSAATGLLVWALTKAYKAYKGAKHIERSVEPVGGILVGRRPTKK